MIFLHAPCIYLIFYHNKSDFTKYFSTLHSVVISEIFPHCKIFSSHWFTVKLFSEKVNLTEFLRKKWGKNLQIPHCALGTYLDNYDCNSIFKLISHKKMWKKDEDTCFSLNFNWLQNCFLASNWLIEIQSLIFSVFYMKLE